MRKEAAAGLLQDRISQLRNRQELISLHGISSVTFGKVVSMTHEEVMQMLSELDIPFAYHHFAEGGSPDPPFICFLFPGSDNFAADNIVYAAFQNLNIELYTDEKNKELEATVEDVLTAHELFWQKSEVWIETEKLYEVLYQLTV